MKKVLIIDEATPAMWLIDRIVSGKYEVIQLNNSLDAWSFLSDGNHCDLIVSDVRTASVEDLQLLENIRSSSIMKDIPFIMLSGFDSHKLSA